MDLPESKDQDQRIESNNLHHDVYNTKTREN